MEIMDQDKIALPKKVRKSRTEAPMCAMEITVFEHSGARALEMNVTSESGIRSYSDG